MLNPCIVIDAILRGIELCLQGAIGRSPPPIFFVLTYVVVLEKLSDTCFFIIYLNRVFGDENRSRKLGYPFNCFTYKSLIFNNETN